MLESKLWTWAHTVGAYYGDFGIELHSKTTPVEGAQLFHSDNILMCMPPSEEEAAKVAGFDQVVWQITGDLSFDFSEEINAVKALARKYPNINGVIIDDLTSTEIARGMTPEDLAEVREQAKSGDTPLDLWGVLYTMNYDIPQISEFMSSLKFVTLWTWEGKDLVDLETNLSRAEVICKDTPITLGIYSYDYGSSQPMAMDFMMHQCNLATKWLKEDRLSGAFMLSTCNADFPYPAVKYAKEWTGKVAETK